MPVIEQNQQPVDDREVSRMKKIYIDEGGWQYAVQPVLRAYVFTVMRRRSGKGKRWRAVHAKEWFMSAQQAEADLERWAIEKGMKLMEAQA